MVSIGPYSEIFKQIKRKSRESTLHAFFKKWGRSSIRDFIREIKSLDHATVKKIKAVALQWHEQTLWSGL
jgi:hypothetical protein